VEGAFKQFAGYIAIGVETGAAILIVVGAALAFYEMFRRLLTGQFVPGTRRHILVHFGTWLLLGLEFELAADIVRTAISPTWNDIGQLAAIATIRTVLNYFLEKDIERFGDREAAMETAVPQRRAA